MEKANSKDMGVEMAYFRFALVAPVIQGTFNDPSAAAYCRRVTENPITRPDGTVFEYRPGTLEKWITLYKSGGMDELMPKSRSDKGSVRRLSDECINEICKIKEKFPRLDAVQIHIRLVQDGFIPATVSPRTIQRYIKNNGLKTPRRQACLKTARLSKNHSLGPCGKRIIPMSSLSRHLAAHALKTRQ